MSSGLLFGTNSIFAKIDNFTSFGLDRKLDDMLGLTPPEIKGPRLSDLTVQTSTYGAHIPRLYGTISVMGNVIWLENGKYKETVRKKKSGGKGGGGSSEPTTTYSYSATFHLSLCEGLIAGIRRMWCGDKLLYNAGSDDLEAIIASNKAAKGWKLYLGSDSQLPDSRYEANVGVGNASAHRGMAYIAFYDFQLADYSNALQGAQFKVEVVSSSSYAHPEMFSSLVTSPDPAAFFQPGSAGGTNFPAYFGSWLGSGNQQHRMNSTGLVSDVPFAIGESADNYRPALCDSTDIARQAWVSSADGTESLLVLESGTWSAYKTVNDFSNFHVVERAGNYWFQWNSDANNLGDPPPSSIWCARFTQQSSPLGEMLVQGVRGALSQDNILAATIDGRLVSVFMPEIDSTVIGSASISILDENMASLASGNIAIPVREGDIFGGESVGYVDDGNLLHIVSPLYLSTGTPTTLYGKYFYMVVDLANISLVRTATLDASALIDPEYRPTVARVEDGVLYICGWTPGKIWRAAFAVGVLGDNLELLSNIIGQEVSSSGLLSASDIDTSGLSSSVRGYRITGGTVRSGLEPLQAVFPLDVRPHGYQIQFLPRGQASVVTIPWEDLGATDGDTPKDILQQSREMGPQLPARTAVKYLDAAREYAIGEQASERLNTEAINKVDRELALVLTADEAAGVAEVLNFLPWLERTDAAFTIPPIYRYLEPGDVVTVTAPTSTYELRLTEIGETQDGRLECKALPNRAALYAPAATGAEGVPATGTIPLAGESLFVALDIPVIDETLQDAPGFVGVLTGYTGGWPGGIVVRSSDEGQTWADLQAYTGKATLGTARGTLPASNCTLIDQRTLTVDLISGELDSVTRDQMLAGVNYAAYGIDGRWEILRFQNATLQADTSRLLSGFVRGEKGTEWATGLHVAGDYFVLLDDPDNAFIGSAVESILAPRLYRGITSGGSLDEAVDVPFTYRGVNLECLSPVYAKGARDGSSNFTGTFTRRSRLSSSWWATGVVAPVGEASESYEIDVMNGAAVVRTITASTPSFAYSAANQVTDFGSAQASITFRIYQLSATVGRGYPLEVTL